MVMVQVFRVNSPQVACETIDGEVVIVDLDHGHYYSLLKTGADLWGCVERHLDRYQMIEEIGQKYDGTIEEITAAIDEFLDQLQQEELIVVDPTITPGTINSQVSNQKPKFEKPILEKFTDMEDLLLLDPIHEVDVDAGWPNVKTK
ncbi:PqqD family protein [Cronbergia sp. UHCC 0137]|uniref:PqqD family protein n=1 Tax=Cronbergia sp. UHCC 0137 TaxID=3110239 RepID=UPI002B206D89|nr:PqqD family protein [Cronbergia sp. UHCC 0137]MEA5619899.1 PqqD family protein [Cronbergia sp. UHCC 0137]